jgi:hypothetical protein
VQTLAGILLPSATVFLLLLCNDKAVLGPWINGRWLNLFTGAVIAVLVMLSIILTASVLYPDISGDVIVEVLVGGSLLAIFVFLVVDGLRRRRRPSQVRGEAVDRSPRAIWRMPPLHELPPAHLTPLTRIWMVVLRGYLVIAGGLVLVRIVQLATSSG